LLKRKKANPHLHWAKKFFSFFILENCCPEVQATGSRLLLFAFLTVLIFFIAETKEVTGNDATTIAALCFLTILYLPQLLSTRRTGR